VNSPSSRPDPAARYYRGASGAQYHEGKRGLEPRALEWVMVFRAEKFQPHIDSAQVVVELGVGAGWNLGRLRCARRIGCDVSDQVAEHVVGLGIEFVPDLRDVPGATADVAICHHTAEHLLDPAEALRQLARILKPGGLLILHAPWERERRYARYQPDEPNQHLFTWSAQSLGNLVTVLGYRLERVAVRRYGYDRFAASLAARLHAGNRGFRLLRAMLTALRPFREVEVLARR
jgi:SAM-dependent methyltransferase